MSLLGNIFGGHQEKSADQQRYEELYAEVTAWEDEEHNPHDPRNEEMDRKQTEQVELYYKLHPEDRVTLPDGVNIEISGASLEELGQAVEEKKRGWFW